MDFMNARHSAKMSRKETAQYFKLSLSTINKYEKTGKAPKAIIECLLMIGGYCPTFSLRNDFKKWNFGSGRLWSPEGDQFTSGDIRAGKAALTELNRLHRIEKRRQKSNKNRKTAKIYQLPIKRATRHKLKA